MRCGVFFPEAREKAPAGTGAWQRDEGVLMTFCGEVN